MNSPAHFLQHTARLEKERSVAQIDIPTQRVLQGSLDNIDVISACDAANIPSFIPDSKNTLVISSGKGPAFLQLKTYGSRIGKGQVCLAFEVDPDPDTPNTLHTKEEVKELAKGLQTKIANDISKMMKESGEFILFDDEFCQQLNDKIKNAIEAEGLFAAKYAPREIKNFETEYKTMSDTISRLYSQHSNNVDDEGHQVNFSLVTAPMERGREKTMTHILPQITKRNGNIPYGACWQEGAEEKLAEIINESLPEKKMGYSLFSEGHNTTLAISGSERSVQALRNAIQQALNPSITKIRAL